MKPTYNREKLEQAICDVGITKGDIVSLQVSLGRLGLMSGVKADFKAISNEVIDSFLSVLGEQGTLIVPTYTYSLGKGEIFDVQNTPSAIGEFPEIFRKKQNANRSRDPMLSNAAIGPMSDRILKGISNSCYGRNSAFEKMLNLNATICTLGIGLHWATFRHHIEEMAKVPFRFLKTFNGKIKDGNILENVQWEYFAAPKGVKNCQPNGAPLEEAAKKKGLIKVRPIGKSEIMAIKSKDYFDFGIIELKKNPWFTALGPRIDMNKVQKI